MKKFLIALVIFLQIFTLQSLAIAQQIAIDEYCAALADCNICAYAISRYVILNTRNTDAEKLKSLVPVLTVYIKNLETKLNALEAVSPDRAEFIDLHNSFKRQYRAIYTWSKELEKAFVSGSNYAVLEKTSQGKYLFRDLRDSFAILKENIKDMQAKGGA